MNTCVICHIAFDPFCDEDGNILIDYETGICKKCLKRIENGEIKVESYDKYTLQNNKLEDGNEEKSYNWDCC